MHKTVEFTYTDAKGKVSTRALFAMVEPGNAYAGIDVTDMSVEDFANFSTEVTQLHNQFVEAVQNVQAKYDLTHNYRKFLVERMSNIVVT